MDTPTPTRTPRHDGWNAERKARFLDSLAARGNVRLACRTVRISPEAAYRLRRRDVLFGRGWAAALVLARNLAEDVLAERAIDGIEEKIYHRGELIDTRRRYDTRLLLAHLARLDRLADEDRAGYDAGRFDELLACIAGEAAPAELESVEDVLPIERETAAEAAAEAAELAARHAMIDSDEEPDLAVLEERCAQAACRGKCEGEARWDLWLGQAHAAVDRVTGWPPSPALPGLPGHPFAPAPDALPPWTPSTPSTSPLALAAPLAVAPRWRGPAA